MIKAVGHLWDAAAPPGAFLSVRERLAAFDALPAAAPHSASGGASRATRPAGSNPRSGTFKASY